MRTLTKRMSEPTPRFFKKLRNIGLGIATVGGALLAAPISLPLILVKVAGYLTVAGGVMSSVSQATVKNEND